MSTVFKIRRDSCRNDPVSLFKVPNERTLGQSHQADVRKKVQEQ